MAKRRAGRPAIPPKERLGKTLGARFRPEEEAAILNAVKHSGKSLANWIREALLKAAGQI